MCGSTVVTFLARGTRCALLWAGDSRAYRLREGRFEQLTRDHSFENVMVWMGKLTPEAAAAHPEAGKVMRVLGIRDDLQGETTSASP